MNKGCYGISPLGRGLSGGLFGFPKGEFGDSILRSPPIDDYTAWWDAAHYESFTLVSGLVSVWADRSANAHDLSQSNAGLRPSYSGGARLNGITIPRFSSTALDTVALDVVPPCTFIAVICPEQLDDEVVMGRIGGNDWRTGFRSSLYGSACFNDTGETSLAGALTQVNSSAGAEYPIVVCQGSENTSLGHHLRLNDVYTDVTFNMPAASSALRLGDRNAALPSGQTYVGSIAEALFWQRKLTHDEVDKTFSYLYEKWGI